MPKFWVMPFLILSAVFSLGFSYDNAIIPVEEIHDGGPPKDGIPALKDPFFVPAERTYFLKDDELVLGVHIKAKAKAYPLRILNWHELVNDELGGQSILVTYCPLCGTAMVFNADFDGKRYLFGVSGKLYNSDVLFYDEETESLWSQLKMKAVTGPKSGTELELLPSRITTWKEWSRKYPDSGAMSPDTGYVRDYSRNPYQKYAQKDKLVFPVSVEDRRLKRKDWVIGIVLGGVAKAYAFKDLAKMELPLIDQVGETDVEVHYDAKSNTAWILSGEWELLPAVQAYWFAWYAFYPNTELYGSEDPPTPQTT